MRTIVNILCVCCIVGAFAASVWAVPPMINYQGAIVDSNGVPLNGTFTARFRLWDDSVSVDAVHLLWVETQGMLATDGLFDVLLGKVTPIPRTVFDNDSVWLEVEVTGHPAMIPRQRIATVAYAFRAARADTATVAISSGPPAYALVYTVALSGGDFGNPWDAVAAISGGVGPYLIRVMPGSYTGFDLTIPSNVTLQGAGKDCCFLLVDGIISMNQPSAMVAGFSIQVTDPSGIDITAMDVTLCDNDITNMSGGIGVRIHGTGVNAIVHDCRIHHCGAWGITVEDAAGPFIHDNQIQYGYGGGILFQQAGGNFSNNDLIYNECFGVKIVDGSPHVACNTIMRSNRGIGLENAGVASPAHIIGNDIWDNLLYGIDCPNSAGARAVISSNTIVRNLVQDINYVAGTFLLPTFNNNTINTTVVPATAPGLYNVDEQGNAVNP